MVMDVQVVEVALLRAKDDQAFRSLIDRLQKPITGYLYRLVRDHEVALDIAQDTFLQVYKEIGKTSASLALDAWIYRIATNYGLQYLKRQRLRKMIHFSLLTRPSAEEHSTSYTIGNGEPNMLFLSSTGPSVEELTEIHILIEQALALLNPKDATCLQLHLANGFTYEQISKIVAITPEAARKRVSRGVEKFRAVYGKNSTELTEKKSVRPLREK